jgi:electron-transferring-flavoprotein dehydrogenase
MTIKRDTMEYDVVIVGAGPAGLAAACRLKQLATEANMDITVCVIEKGSEVGSHILSGAIFDTRALDELFPDWQSLDAPVQIPVLKDEFYLYRNEASALKWPNTLLPRTMYNKGNYIISLSKLCRWLARQAETLGVEIYPGFAAQEVIIENDIVRGIITGDHGINRNGEPKQGLFTPGIELRGRYTLFAEGSRGHLGKRLQSHFNLQEKSDPQHYAIGLKELWEVEPDRHKRGLVVHGVGWPLDNANPGGSFLYHYEDKLVIVGLIVDLSYSNPFLSPFDEFQRFKHHPVVKQYLNGGNRITYGARAITKGGFNSLPEMVFPGGALIGCNLGTLNFAKIKGIHTAMKSGMLAAEAIVDELHSPDIYNTILTGYPGRFRDSWLYNELYQGRNFGPAIHKYGTLLGGTFNFIDQNLFRGRSPVTLHDDSPDYTRLLQVDRARKMNYPKPDGKLSFDKLTSVYLTNTSHLEDQPVHLTLKDPDIPIKENFPRFDEPAQRYCPAGVYEVIKLADDNYCFQVNAQNCIHCKVCDIKDPSQNIVWIAPEGSSGPNYSNM